MNEILSELPAAAVARKIGAAGRGSRPSAEAAAVSGAKQAPRDADKTRLKILAAAAAEFAEKGLAGARVDAIAEASGANKRMIYYYFSSKDGLYTAVLERAYTDMRDAERALALDHLEPFEGIRKLVEFKFDYFVENPTTISLLNGENMLGAAYLKKSDRLRDMHAILVRTIDGLLERGALNGTMRSGVDPLHLYISISALSYFYFSNAATLSTAFGRELATPAENAIRRKHAVDVILAFLKA
ncbi:transcriptional regulator, TetR family [Rhizobiales bacterium GAS113]|jgi:TetR/AcrR family transcriptional regulator|nr:transcriptional regulator, TetR family [Rhizobiales bacterium GAS113]